MAANVFNWIFGSPRKTSISATTASTTFASSATALPAVTAAVPAAVTAVASTNAKTKTLPRTTVAPAAVVAHGGEPIVASDIPVVTPNLPNVLITQANAPEHLHLFMAAQRGDLKEVDRLLNLGAQVDACESDGLTALHAAACRGHFTIVQRLLAAGASVYEMDDYGKTALLFAVPLPRSRLFFC